MVMGSEVMIIFIVKPTSFVVEVSSLQQQQNLCLYLWNTKVRRKYNLVCE